MTDARTDRAKQFLRSIMQQDESLEALTDDPHQLESVANRSTARPEEIDAAKSAAQKIQMDQVLSPDEQFALEAIIIPDKRPAIDIVDGDYHITHPLWTHFETDSNIHQRLRQVIPSIGRIELPGHPTIPYAGTGFVAGDDLLMTNRHVAEIFADGLGIRHIAFKPGYASGIDFKRERNRPAELFLKVVDVMMIHPYWDMALLRVAGLDSEQTPLVLSLRNPQDMVDQEIAVIGYPAFDIRNPADVQNKVFDGVYYVKRLQPGKLRPRERVDSFGNRVLAAAHDSSTLGGNSGSAVIDVATGQVIALHFGGTYLKSNFGVPTFELARDARLIEAKLKFDAGAKAQPIEWEDSWRHADAELPSLPVAPPSKYGAVPPAPAADRGPSQSQSTAATTSPREGSATWTIPLHISVKIGQPMQLLLSSQGLHGGDQATSQIDPDEEAVIVDQDYRDRQGYDPHFLNDIVVPLPAITKEMERDTALVGSHARRNGDPYELAYYHYSVYMNKSRRTAWFSAANVDGDQRPNIGKRQGDRWYTDPRILKSEQLGRETFEHGIDRGHLTRREDTAWGEDVDSAIRANNDTFHFTNCSLQASPFNRGKDRWQGLEQFLLEQHAKKEKRRMIVITGPLFASNDPVYKNNHMTYSVRCPLQFWKVCVLIRRDGTPSASAFILGQEDIQNLPGFEEAFDVAATQIKVADLESRTGLDFGEVKRFDHFAAGGQPGTLELPTGAGSTRTAKVIRTGDDIVV